MSTKDKPGQHDCYKALANDEPYFVLRANDPCAPQIVLQWAANYIKAKMIDREGSDPEKVWAKYQEALDLAASMEAWRVTALMPCGNCGLPRNDHRDDEVAHRWRVDKPPVRAEEQVATAHVLCTCTDPVLAAQNCPVHGWPGQRTNLEGKVITGGMYAGLDRDKGIEDPPPDTGPVGTSIYG